jgi:cbb3-type cytochrome oxidase cytochrome c subunit
MTQVRQWRWAGLVLGLGVLAMLLWFRTCPAVAQPNRADLRPGLIATYRDDAGVGIMQLDAAMALTLQLGEASHPRLTTTGGSITWEGYLNVFRPSEYRFSALVRGKFKLMIDGKEVVSGDAEDKVKRFDGHSMKLAAGVYPLKGEFTRFAGEARLEVYWEAPLFIKEPLPIANLRHLPSKAPQLLAHDRAVERGRFLVEEFSCARCHVPGSDDKLGHGLQSREGPNLARVGQRYRAAWIYHWLKDPQAVSPTAVMPRLFSDDEQGHAEILAVTTYLQTLGGPFKETEPPAKSKIADSIKRGRQLFSSTGCVVCHPQAAREVVAPEAPLLHHLVSATGPSRVYPLPDQGQKTTPAHLAAYLLNPHKTDPSGRMPQVVTASKEAQDLANYLCYGTKDAAPQELPKTPAVTVVVDTFRKIESNQEAIASFVKMPVEAQLQALGQRLLAARNCLACHSVEAGKAPAPSTVASASFEALKNPASHKRGCLAEVAAQRGTAPIFPLGQNREPIRLFLTDGTKGAGSPSPVFAARVVLQRFNCMACHNRDGEGGLAGEVADELRKFEKAENAEAISPPTLSGVGHKLRTSWFRAVLTQSGRSRPWMGLRMPQFGEAHVGKLPEAIAALEGTVPDDTIHTEPWATETIKLGRQLIGKNNGYGCISCHDIAGVANGGTRGPDLALTSQHVRYEWYRRWLESAQRMDPGTKMPSIILDGRTMLDTVLSGNANAQAAAMWAYLSVGPTLQLPEGLEPPKGLTITVKDRPSLLRTFMPEAGTKAIAVSYPEGVSTVFDATQCRLAYGWNGNFLDASPVWANRGGAPAKVLGPKFWVAPQGFPWGVGATEPDFTAIAKDPAYGGALPEGIVFQGQKRLFFNGYKVDSQGQPTFLYRVGVDQKKSVTVEEQPLPLRGTVAVGLARRLHVENNAQTDLWLHVLTVPDTKKARVLDAKGREQDVSAKAGTEMPTADRVFVIPQVGEGYQVVSAVAPPAVQWHWGNGGRQLMLRLPRDAAHAVVVLRIWSVPRDEPVLLREVLDMK